MPAYWIAHVEVTDEALYGEYAKIATEAIAAHGGEFLARGGRYKQLEGKDRARNVVAVFPTFDDAIACYESETIRVWWVASLRAFPAVTRLTVYRGLQVIEFMIAGISMKIIVFANK